MTAQHQFNRIAKPFVLSHLLSICAEIQRRFGLRWAEVSRLKKSDIIDGEYLHFAGAKKSYDRYLHAPDICEALKPFIGKSQHTRFFTFSYNVYHKYLSNTTTTTARPGHKKRDVSNQFRVKYFRKLVDHAGKATPSISRAGGHKTNKAIFYYLDPNTHPQPERK